MEIINLKIIYRYWESKIFIYQWVHKVGENTESTANQMLSSTGFAEMGAQKWVFRTPWWITDLMWIEWKYVWNHTYSDTIGEDQRIFSSQSKK